MDIITWIVLVIGFEWARRSVNELQDRQRAILEEVARLAAAAGLPPRHVPMLQCPKCTNYYAPELTGCPICGAAKPPAATPVFVDATAVNPQQQAAPASAGHIA